MTVAELTAVLQKLPQDVGVYVWTCTNGWEAIVDIQAYSAEITFIGIDTRAMESKHERR